MADPTSLKILVQNAVGAPISGATADVVVRRGVEWREEHKGLAVPATVPLRAGFIQIEVAVRAPDYYDERVIMTFRSDGHHWETTNPACALAETGQIATLAVVLGRIRFAPIVMLPDDMRVPTTFLPGAVLANQQGYRTINLDPEERMRVLAPVATGDPDSPGWDRFRWSERPVKLAGRGNWLLLEYGDTSGRPDAMRHLLGVWAPHSFAGMAPPVVVQVTPNTRTPFYPPDKRPFTGAYPYGCVAAQNAVVDKKTKTVELRSSRQAYAELPANRCLGQYKIIYQLYAARPDLFDGPNGPIVITPSPALIAGAGPLRAPFEHPDGMGRMVAEVLRFLYARRLTLPMSAGGLHLRFQGSEVRIGGVRPAGGPIGIPKQTLTTVLCHSAGVVPVLSLARNLARPKFPADFPEALWGGRNVYCDQSWTNLWVIDGVATPGGIGIPSPGGPAAQTWAAWLRRGGRRMVMVYTPSGLGGLVAPELVSRPAARSGKAGRIEEAADGRVRWLHMAYTYLRADPAQNPKGIRPEFGPPSDDAERSHNKVYEFGVGYAAARPAR
ncbi:hypothetical protein [Sphaerisporangium perillae]|uniref:hypothetical protein n=1 Tax=Sphaerisporangium perillae TaxID=2935860 RepID=UPI00200CC519|nr:hypothetical protein [Sphaerisporangium perillae]